MKLPGKVAIVTGGGQGIGEAISLGLAEQGAKIAILDINFEMAEKTASLIRKKGSVGIALKCNVEIRDDLIESVNSATRELGEIDILVNNAGLLRRTPLFDISEEEWDLILNVNLKGPFMLSQLVAKRWVDGKRTGKIVNIASIYGKVAALNVLPYCSSKGGMEMLTKAMALELAPHGINVNGVAPGPTKTDITKPHFENSEKLGLLTSNIPLGRMANPKDIANAALFLAGPESDLITGEILTVDGGWVIK